MENIIIIVIVACLMAYSIYYLRLFGGGEGTSAKETRDITQGVKENKTDRKW